MTTKPPELIRGLGFWSATAMVVGSMIGTGIFLVPSEMAIAAGSVEIIFAAWVVGGLLTLFGAFALAEMGSALPVAGGPYVYLKRAFGPSVGFLYGWTLTMVERPASLATIAAGLLRFATFLMPVLAVPLFTWEFPLPFQTELHEFRFTPAQPLAVVVVLLVTAINYAGVRLGGRVQVVLTAVKVMALLAVVAIGFAVAMDGAPASTAGGPVTSPPVGSVGGLSGFLVALVAALWAYDGWTAVSLVGSEVTNPRKNISRALVAGVLVVASIYLLANVAYFSVLSLEGVAQSPSVASDVVERFSGDGTAQWLTLAMIISALGTLNSSTLSGARVPYAMARDGLFFRFAADVHRRFRTPGRALWFQGCLGSLFALTGTFSELFSLVIFSAWIIYGLTVAALFRLRHREPALDRPYRAWGYPWAQALFVIGALALTVNLWLELPVRSSIGLLLIFSGLLFYRRWRRSGAE